MSRSPVPKGAISGFPGSAAVGEVPGDAQPAAPSTSNRMTSTETSFFIKSVPRLFIFVYYFISKSLFSIFGYMSAIGLKSVTGLFASSKERSFVIPDSALISDI